jgi:hypothetical protein
VKFSSNFKKPKEKCKRNSKKWKIKNSSKEKLRRNFFEGWSSFCRFLGWFVKLCHWMVDVNFNLF